MSRHSTEGRLTLTPDEFRRVALQAVDLATEYLRGLRETPAFPHTSAVEATALFDEPAPERGIGDAAIDDIKKVLATARPGGPAFFGYVLGSGEPVAAAPDLVASVLNQNVTAWRSSPGAVTIERVVVRWLAEAIGCPGFCGSLTGGGSTANLMALAMAREIAQTIVAGFHGQCLAQFTACCREFLTQYIAHVVYPFAVSRFFLLGAPHHDPRIPRMADHTDATGLCRHDDSDACPTGRFAAVAFLYPEKSLVSIQVKLINLCLDLPLRTSFSDHL
jgi:hypothetical protein